MKERALIRETLADLAGSVTIRSYTSDVESSYSRGERELLDAIADGSPKIALEILADRWTPEREAQVGIARTPCIVVLGESDHGLRYYGLPDGYELVPFLETIRAVGARRSGLAEANVARLHALDSPRHLEVFASPG
jgi:alkyl hydroperoxide reductase subunit AhpF